MASVKINQVSHFYRLEGDRRHPLLVLLHPVGADHGIWDQVMPALLPFFRILRYDLRGHGGTTTSAGDYSVAMLASDLDVLTDALGLVEFAVCGVSIGGLAGLTLATAKPHKVRSLVIANASPRLPLSEAEWNHRIAHVLCHGMQSQIDGMVARMIAPAFREDNSPYLHSMLQVFESTDVNGYASCLAALRDVDVRQLCCQVRVPTLVIGSSADLAVPRADIDYFAETIPGARLTMLPGGHLSLLEQPQLVAAAIRDFVSR